MDRPYFIGPFRPRPGVQKKKKKSKNVAGTTLKDECLFYIKDAYAF